MIELCLSQQPRVDRETELRYNQEVGTYLYGNFGLLEIREFCTEFIQKFSLYPIVKAEPSISNSTDN